MVYKVVSKTTGLTPVRVQLPPSAHSKMSKSKFPDKDFVWSPELAYAVGLIATDGNLSKDGRHIAMRSSDYDQLENFKKCLNLENKIGAPKVSGPYSKRICYRLQFGDVQFYRWLVNIGLSPSKTYTIGPLQIPDEFFRDFLRGHLDGDGTIVSYQDCYNAFKNPSYVYTRLFVRFISVSQIHIEWIRSVVQKLTGLHGDLFEVRSKNKNRVSIWQLKYMKKESIKLLSWLYYSPNLPCLERKRQKADGILKRITKIQRKPYLRQSLFE